MNTRRKRRAANAGMESSRAAWAARRTMPGPASTRYASSPTTIATAGPDRSGSAFGVPVPSMTTRVRRRRGRAQPSRTHHRRDQRRCDHHDTHAHSPPCLWRAPRAPLTITDRPLPLTIPMTRLRTFGALAAGFLVFSIANRAVEAQAPSTSTLEDTIPPGANFDKAQFRFWAPPGVATLRGTMVLVPGSNGDGRAMAEDSVWQAFATKQRLALLACRFTDKPHDQNFIEDYVNVSHGSGQALLDALGHLAERSKHPELASEPLLFWGMSAGGQFNYEFAAWKPERVLAFVVNKGGIYYTALTPRADAGDSRAAVHRRQGSGITREHDHGSVRSESSRRRALGARARAKRRARRGTFSRPVDHVLRRRDSAANGRGGTSAARRGVGVRRRRTHEFRSRGERGRLAGVSDVVAADGANRAGVAGDVHRQTLRALNLVSGRSRQSGSQNAVLCA